MIRLVKHEKVILSKGRWYITSVMGSLYLNHECKKAREFAKNNNDGSWPSANFTSNVYLKCYFCGRNPPKSVVAAFRLLET